MYLCYVWCVPLFRTELIEKLEVNESSDFYLFKILRAHILPLTNCAFNKSGDKYVRPAWIPQLTTFLKQSRGFCQ